MNLSKKWLRAALIRAIKTVAQTAVSMLTVGQYFADVDWLGVLSISAVAGIISILTSIAGLPEVDEYWLARFRACTCPPRVTRTSTPNRRAGIPRARWAILPHASKA